MAPEQSPIPPQPGSETTAIGAPADEPAALPLLRAGRWAMGFLLIAIALAVVFSQTMPDFFRAAYQLGG
ncbi:MAG: hypothetical protein ACRDRL_15830 [Sciscionella sp.]